MFYDSFLALCVSRGISPSKAAEEAGLSAAHVNRWKNGSTPTNPTKMKLCVYFGLPCDYFDENKNTAESVDSAVLDDMDLLREKIAALPNDKLAILLQEIAKKLGEG